MSPYSDIYGGSILNATINMYAFATIEPLHTGKIELRSVDILESETHQMRAELPADGELKLLKGVYNRIVKQFRKEPLSFRLTTHVDAPPGSGLGSSSTLVVAIIGAFVEWLKLPLGEYDIAQLAYEIEREDLMLAGGKQDQYAATFGGFNFMEFNKDKVIVNPLRIRKSYINELQHNLVLLYTGTSRESAAIIKKQQQNITDNREDALQATHTLKEQSVLMKEALLTGQIHRVGEVLQFGWESKKQMAKGISSPMLDEIYSSAMKAGATGGKISGAGGGGFMFFYCPDNTRYAVIKAMGEFESKVHPYQFTSDGLYGYTLNQ